MIPLIAIALAQLSTPLNLNGQAIYRASCDGGITCTKSGQTLTIIGSGGSAPSGSSDFDGGYNVIEDEGAPLTKRTAVDFTGAGVSCVDTGTKTQCTISGGGAGSVNTATGAVSFDGGSLDAYATVTAAWASGASVITCVPTGEEASVEGLVVTVLSKSAGSFTVRAEPRNGTHWGSLSFECIGN